MSLFISETLFAASTNWGELQKKIEKKYPQVTHISAEDLSVWLDNPQRDTPVLLDIRQKSEYDMSHLPGAIHVAPGDDVKSKLPFLKKGDPIVLYCSVGMRSSKFAAQLMKRGFEQVYQLKGSIFGWANQGYGVYREGKMVEEVHPYNKKWGQYLNEKFRMAPAG